MNQEGDNGVFSVVVVLYSFLCSIPVNKIPRCGIAVISNPTVCDDCTFNFDWSLFLVMCIMLHVSGGRRHLSKPSCQAFFCFLPFLLSHQPPYTPPPPHPPPRKPDTQVNNLIPMSRTPIILEHPLYYHSNYLSCMKRGEKMHYRSLYLWTPDV